MDATERIAPAIVDDGLTSSFRGGRAGRLGRLRALITMMVVLALAFAGVGGLLAWYYDDRPSAFASAIAFGLAVWLFFVARAQARAGRLERAATAICLGLLATAILLGAVVPEADTALVSVPLLAVAFGLTYLDSKMLLRLMTASIVVVVVLGVEVEVAPPLSRLPSDLIAAFRIAGYSLGAATIMTLLWEYSARLREALSRMGEANSAMAVAEVRVSQVNDELRHRVDELELRSRELTQLAKMGDLLQACETSEEAYSVIAQTASPLFSGDGGTLFELTPSRNAMESVASWGQMTGSKPVFAPGECWALRRGRPYLLEDPGTEIVCPHVDADASSYLCVPLAAQSETLGLLHVQFRARGTGTKRHEQMLERQRVAVTLGEHLSLALANFRLRATLRERSTRDELTGLYNRRFLEEALDREIRRAVRENRPLGVIMIDLDHFKRFNDAYGHASGDFVLRLVGEYLQSGVRAEDIACRYGGEEFAILLPKASAQDTMRRAETLREGVSALRPVDAGSRFPPVTLSMGVAAYPEHGASGEAVLRAADQALYLAKARGRDRVEVADSPAAVPEFVRAGDDALAS
jgi:diguanylate cyclase (GGDEF)-like protein